MDCDYGFKCIKSGYGEGICVGKKYDNKPSRDTTRVKEPSGFWNKKKGSSCSYDTECDIGKKCLKMGSSLYGTCS